MASGKDGGVSGADCHIVPVELPQYSLHIRQNQLVIPREKLPVRKESGAQAGEGRRANEHIHDDHLQLDRFQGRRAGQDHPGHRPRQLNQADGLGRIDDGHHPVL